MDVVCGIFIVVIVMVIILQYSKSAADENGVGAATAASLRARVAGLRQDRGTTATAPAATADAVKDIVDAKEIIMARSQRRVYGLDGDEVNVVDSRWAHKLMTSWCTEFDDRVADMCSLERIVNGFCERVENVVEAYLANLSQYHKQLATITEASDLVEQEISKTKAKERLTADDYSCHDVDTVSADQSSVQCLVATTSQDDLLSVYEQFVDEIQKSHL